jgi:hypothetical protein
MPSGPHFQHPWRSRKHDAIPLLCLSPHRWQLGDLPADLQALRLAVLGSAAVHAPSGTHGPAPGRTLSATLVSRMVDHSNLSNRLTGRASLSTVLVLTAALDSKVLPVGLTASSVVGPLNSSNSPSRNSGPVLGSAVAHAPYISAASAALVPVAVDPPHSTNIPSRSPGPGLSTAFCSGSVAAHTPLSTLGGAVPHAIHRSLYSKVRHLIVHYNKTILPQTLHGRR